MTMVRYATAYLLAVLLVGCVEPELRGIVRPSKDGKTYLIIADANGGACGKFFVDGKEWKQAVGSPGLIPQGIHTVRCGDSGDVEIETQAGTTFEFNYWGP